MFAFAVQYQHFAVAAGSRARQDQTLIDKRLTANFQDRIEPYP